MLRKKFSLSVRFRAENQSVSLDVEADNVADSLRALANLIDSGVEVINLESGFDLHLCGKRNTHIKEEPTNKKGGIK